MTTDGLKFILANMINFDISQSQILMDRENYY